MRKISLVKFFALAAISMSLVFATSCDKEDESAPVTIEAQLLGTWTGDEYYEDGQLSQYNDFFKISSIEFNEGGTGEEISLFGVQPLTWSYDDATEKLRIETETVEDEDEDGITFSVEGSIIEGAEITKIDASNLWFTHQDEGVTVEQRYKK